MSIESISLKFKDNDEAKVTRDEWEAATAEIAADIMTIQTANAEIYGDYLAAEKKCNELQARVAELEEKLAVVNVWLPRALSDYERQATHKRAMLQSLSEAPKPSAEPVFWYRQRSDGGYEGPVHNSGIGDIRKNSGAWSPLYADQPPAVDAQPEIDLDELRFIIFDAMEEALSIEEHYSRKERPAMREGAADNYARKIAHKLNFVAVEAQEQPAPIPTGRSHELKTDPAVFDAVARGKKTFEIRWNDRDFQVGDELILRRTRHSGDKMLEGQPLIYVGPPLRVQVTYILHGPAYGLAAGWVIMCLTRPQSPEVAG